MMGVFNGVAFNEKTEEVDECPKCGKGSGHEVYKVSAGGTSPYSVRSQKTIDRMAVKGEGKEKNISDVDRDDSFFCWMCVSESGEAYLHRGTLNYD